MPGQHQRGGSTCFRAGLRHEVGAAATRRVFRELACRENRDRTIVVISTGRLRSMSDDIAVLDGTAQRAAELCVRTTDPARLTQLFDRAARGSHRSVLYESVDNRLANRGITHFSSKLLSQPGRFPVLDADSSLTKTRRLVAARRVIGKPETTCRYAHQKSRGRGRVDSSCSCNRWFPCYCYTTFY